MKQNLENLENEKSMKIPNQKIDIKTKNLLKKIFKNWTIEKLNEMK